MRIQGGLFNLSIMFWMDCEYYSNHMANTIPVMKPGGGSIYEVGDFLMV